MFLEVYSIVFFHHAPKRLSYPCFLWFPSIYFFSSLFLFYLFLPFFLSFFSSLTSFSPQFFDFFLSFLFCYLFFSSLFLLRFFLSFFLSLFFNLIYLFLRIFFSVENLWIFKYRTYFSSSWFLCRCYIYGGRKLNTGIFYYNFRRLCQN